MIESGRDDCLIALYTENADVAAAFWGWRHKMLTAFITAVAAAVLMASWFYQHPELKRWVFIPFVLAAGFSLLTDIMDRVNITLLQDCYRTGAMLEEELQAGGGIFKAIDDSRTRSISDHRVLRWIYMLPAPVSLQSPLL